MNYIKMHLEKRRIRRKGLFEKDEEERIQKKGYLALFQSYCHQLTNGIFESSLHNKLLGVHQ